MYEQLNIFDMMETKKRIEENQCLGEPCCSCDVVWCSIQCFIRRGYVWDKVNRFLKKENGEKIRKPLEFRKCKKIYEGEKGEQS